MSSRFDDWDVVSLEPPIPRNQGEFLELCLRDQQAVEGVVVVSRQVLDSQRVRGGDVERGEAVAFQALFVVAGGFELADGLFHGDFPSGDRAYEYGGVRVNDGGLGFG